MPVSVGQAIGPAMLRTGFVLFKTFRTKKWLLLAVPAALTLLFMGLPPIFQLVVQLGMQFMPPMSFEDVLIWYLAHQLEVMLWLLTAVGVLTPIYLLSRWAGSRGYFVFLHNIVTNEAGMRGAWTEFRVLGNSFMRLWMAWDLLVFNVLLVLAVIAAWIAWPDIKPLFLTGQYDFTAHSVVAILVFLGGALLAAIPLTFVHAFVFRLVIPVMYVRRLTAKPALGVAWREIFLPHKWTCLVFFLTHFVSNMAKGFCVQIGLLLLMVVTLGIALVVALLPIVGNYPMALTALPVTTFEAAFGLYFVEQFGDAYRISWVMPPAVPGLGFPVQPAPMPPPTS
jgi:hypothetical protein